MDEEMTNLIKYHEKYMCGRQGCYDADSMLNKFWEWELPGKGELDAVTNNMLAQNLLKNLQIANNKMDIIQQQLATGRRITKPSDDPVKHEDPMRLKSTLSALETMAK
jgi:hypothetical protein